jgi:cysteine desulfurase
MIEAGAVLILLVIIAIVIAFTIISYYIILRPTIKKIMDCDTSHYFDNNATTIPPKAVVEYMCKWMYCGNASAGHQEGIKAAAMIKKVTKYILETVNAANGSNSHDASPYEVIFNSGASEGNCMILNACVKSYLRQVKKRPHIISSVIEHKSILNCLHDLEETGLCDVSYADINSAGQVTPEEVESHITPRTILISIMAANNETGIINDVAGLCDMAHKHNIPFHCDYVQLFGKLPPDLGAVPIDAITVSFHKLYGPVGVGCIILSKSLISGYDLRAEVCGTQNDGLRGGTLNVAGIAGAHAGMKYTFNKRNKKNENLAKLREFIIKKLAAKYPLTDLSHYFEPDYTKYPHQPVELVVFGVSRDAMLSTPVDKPSSSTNGDGLPSAPTLPNTILLAICKNKGRPFCNSTLKNALLKDDYVVSIGSACNTASPKASHVISAFNVTGHIRRGVIRVSLGDTNKASDVKGLVSALIKHINEQLADVD